MTYNLVLNSSNVIGSNNSIFKYNFINGAFHINENSEMCVSQIVLPYSWFNINKGYYTNATLQYKFPNGETDNTYTVTFPNGYFPFLYILYIYINLFLNCFNSFLNKIIQIHN